MLECKYSIHYSTYICTFIRHFLNLLSTYLFVDLLMIFFATTVGVVFLPGFGTNVACWDGCLGARGQLKKLPHMDEVSFRTI